MWISKQSEAVGKTYSISDAQHDRFHEDRDPHDERCDYREKTEND